MRLSFRPAARLDIREARDWYEAQAPGLGAEFVRAVDAMVAFQCTLRILSHRVSNPAP